MTVLTKASDMMKKSDVIETPLFDNTSAFDVESVNAVAAKPRLLRSSTTIRVYKSKCNRFLLWTTFVLAALLLVIAIMALISYNDVNIDSTMRYKGYCTIPIGMSQAASQAQKKNPTATRMPLHWSSEPEVTVVSTVDEDAEALNRLLERFDISENVEKISVYNSGRSVEFIHDFTANASGIVDAQRCFVMALDPEAVLPPGLFVLHIASGADFDVTRVRHHLRALLPATGGNSAPHRLGRVLSERCSNRSTYDLERQDGDIIRKRSADEPSQEYVHFAGNNIQEITIDNMAELLTYERQAA